MRERPKLFGREGSRGFVSMQIKFMAVMVVTALAVVLTALWSIPLCLQIFRKVHTDPERVEARLEAYVRDFAAYVAEENVSASDTKAVVEWTKRHRSVYLTVFNDVNEQFGAAGGELVEEGSLPDMEPFFDKILPADTDSSIPSDPESNMYIVRFANGIHSIAVVDYSLATGADAIIIVSVVIFLCSFFIVLLIYNYFRTRDIVMLSREVKAVSDGDLQADIESLRNDEIGQLAHDVDVMRNTILQKMEEQQKAWQANSDLLTSMTHDIRTPLTTLLGYMELLNADSEDMTEEQKRYIRTCTAKAEQIKGLSDELFLYFWAYNRSAPETPPETMGAALLFEQLLGDHIPTIENAGLTVVPDLRAILPEDTVTVHVDRLRRVTDNVFDNLKKYADRTHPVTVTATEDNGTLTLRFTNRVDRKMSRTHGTRVGVKTCVNMMEQMGGGFLTETDGDTYSAVLTLPLSQA